MKKKWNKVGSLWTSLINFDSIYFKCPNEKSHSFLAIIITVNYLVPIKKERRKILNEIFSDNDASEEVRKKINK